LGATVKFSYNSEGEVTSCTDAGGTRSEYVYDLRDRLTEVRRHGKVRDKYLRDAAGNLVAKHAADGRLLLQVEIGPGNLPVKRVLSSGDEHTFQYGKGGRCLIAGTKRDVVEFTYDSLGNRTLEMRNGKGVEHRFASLHKPAESLFFQQFLVRYERRANETIFITDPGGKKHRVTFKPFGIVERQFSNGSQETAQYDNQGRCWLKCVYRLDGPMWSRRYDWSGEGELRRIRDNVQGETRHEYDAAHRLRRRIFAHGRTEEYEVDLADNLLRQPGLEEVTLQEGNRLLTINGLPVEHNDRNHIAARHTPDGVVRYFYDSRDQLIRVESPQGLWRADYDAFGRRTRKSWAGQTTEYYWNNDQLIAELQPNGQLRLYIYADPLAVTPLMFLDYESMDAPPESGRRYFIFTDQIGTPCLIEDERGTEVWRARTEPYGRAQVASGAKINFNLRFPGHYFDSELGLHYNRFRYYDSTLGRYIQSDPWGIAGGYNLYSYRSNPLLDVDVRGLGEEDNPNCAPPSDGEEGPRPPPGFPSEDEVGAMLPVYNGETTHGVLVTNEGAVIPLASGTRPEGFQNYESSAHVEGQAAIAIRQAGSTGGVVYHNNPNGTCGYCSGHVPTLLPPGAQMIVVPPQGARANNSRATAEPTIYTGNNRTPKPPG
jgi:RHS repeat-associated protein